MSSSDGGIIGNIAIFSPRPLAPHCEQFGCGVGRGVRTFAPVQMSADADVSAKKKAATKNKAPRELMGKRVSVDRQGVVHKGLVKFHGPTQFHDGAWVGVELDTPDGTHSGWVGRWVTRFFDGFRAR